MGKNDNPDEKPSPSTRVALIWWGLGSLLVVLVFARFNLNFYQAQARYLHPALLPIALTFGLAWRQRFATGHPWAARLSLALFATTLVVLTLWNVFGWRTLI